MRERERTNRCFAHAISVILAGLECLHKPIARALGSMREREREYLRRPCAPTISPISSLSLLCVCILTYTYYQLLLLRFCCKCKKIIIFVLYIYNDSIKKSASTWYINTYINTVGGCFTKSSVKNPFIVLFYILAMCRDAA